jgi:hypothetical protein
MRSRTIFGHPAGLVDPPWLCEVSLCEHERRIDGGKPKRHTVLTDGHLFLVGCYCFGCTSTRIGEEEQRTVSSLWLGALSGGHLLLSR